MEDAPPKLIIHLRSCIMPPSSNTSNTICNTTEPSLFDLYILAIVKDRRVIVKPKVLFFCSRTTTIHYGWSNQTQKVRSGQTIYLWNWLDRTRSNTLIEQGIDLNKKLKSTRINVITGLSSNEEQW